MIVLEAIVTRLPPRQKRPNAPLKRCWWIAGTTPISAWSFWCASWKVTLKKGQKIRMMAADAVYQGQTNSVGVFKPKKVN
jgi:translation elongation factor EF-4